MARSQNHQANKHASDAGDRYRQAAEVALQQLEWTIRYLQRIRKPDIAQARWPRTARTSGRQLMDEPGAAACPAKQTGET